jgi:hypothetical protein
VVEDDETPRLVLWWQPLLLLLLSKHTRVGHLWVVSGWVVVIVRFIVLVLFLFFCLHFLGAVLVSIVLVGNGLIFPQWGIQIFYGMICMRIKRFPYNSTSERVVGGSIIGNASVNSNGRVVWTHLYF